MPDQMTTGQQPTTKGTEMEYTVEIQASNPDGTIWQALAPAETITAVSAYDAGRDTATNQNIAEGNNWRVVVWEGAAADTSTDPVATYGPDGCTIHTGKLTTYTAWITTDRSALETDLCDVSVLANDADGNSHGDPLWHTVTTVPCAAEGRLDDDLIREAKDLLAAAGWQAEGPLEGVPTGYVINVARS